MKLHPLPRHPALRFFLGACLALLTFTRSAQATDVIDLYTNGPVKTDPVSSYNIAEGPWEVSNSFIVDAHSNITLIKDIAIVAPSDITDMAFSWSIGRDIFLDDIVESVLAAPTWTRVGSPAQGLYSASFNTGGFYLNAGTYWLTLSGGYISNDEGDLGPISWAASANPSSPDAYQNQGSGSIVLVPGEAFTITGVHVVGVPEPSTAGWVLALLTLAFFGLRKISRQRHSDVEA